MSIPAGLEDLSAAWVRTALADAGHAGAIEIRDVRAERIGVGYGLDGTVARVTTMGPGGEQATLVAKWCRPDAGAHEARFYRAIVPQLGIDSAHLLAAAVDADRAVLLLTDIAPARQGDAIVGATRADAERVIDVAAGLHAPFWAAPDDAVVAWLPRWGRDPAGDAERTRARLPGFFARWSTVLSPRVLAAAERLPETLLAAHASLATAPVTVIHGDLHLDNFLFRPDGAPVVIDWTHTALGPAAVDVARVLAEGMTVESRRALESVVVDRYLQALSRSGIRYDARDFTTHVDDALAVLFAGAIRSKHAGVDAPPRLVPVIENLVRTVTAAIDDRAARTAP